MSDYKCPACGRTWRRNLFEACLCGATMTVACPSCAQLAAIIERQTPLGPVGDEMLRKRRDELLEKLFMHPPLSAAEAAERHDIEREMEVREALDANERLAEQLATTQAEAAAMDEGLLRGISALNHLPPDEGPIRRLAGEAIAVMRAAREGTAGKALLAENKRLRTALQAIADYACGYDELNEACDHECAHIAAAALQKQPDAKDPT